jgi:3-oxoacyl-[acyl-carrier protein] reductase
MDLGIAGRCAAVAAGSDGLGLATARALVSEGVRVAVCGRDEARLERATAELGAVGIRADLDAGRRNPLRGDGRARVGSG